LRKYKNFGRRDWKATDVSEKPAVGFFISDMKKYGAGGFM
jgi:hypothetical protein